MHEHRPPRPTRRNRRSPLHHRSPPNRSPLHRRRHRCRRRRTRRRCRRCLRSGRRPGRPTVTGLVGTAVAPVVAVIALVVVEDLVGDGRPDEGTGEAGEEAAGEHAPMPTPPMPPGRAENVRSIVPGWRISARVVHRRLPVRSQCRWRRDRLVLGRSARWSGPARRPPCGRSASRGEVDEHGRPVVEAGLELGLLGRRPPATSRAPSARPSPPGPPPSPGGPPRSGRRLRSRHRCHGRAGWRRR